MKNYSQGDVIKITGFKNLFLVISKNSFIKKTSVFHVCPVLDPYPAGPLHIPVDKYGTVICEQIKLIDPNERACSQKGRISYNEIMNISDAIQGIFEYD